MNILNKIRYRTLDLNNKKSTNSLSIFSIIENQIKTNIDDLNYKNFPELPGSEDDLKFAPGLMDNFFVGDTDKRNKGWKK